MRYFLKLPDVPMVSAPLLSLCAHGTFIMYKVFSVFIFSALVSIDIHNKRDSNMKEQGKNTTTNLYSTVIYYIYYINKKFFKSMGF